MSANAMNIEDVYAVLNAIHAQSTNAEAGVIAYDPSSFVSVANATLQTGTDIVYNALMNTIAKTVFSVRPYSRQFGGLIVNNLKWGAIVRKIQFGDTDALADKAFSGLPADGQSVDHYTINRGDTFETRYYGSAEYQDVMTVFRDQLITAFEGPEQLGSFISAKAQEINNKWVQWTEDLVRGMFVNAITAKKYYESASVPTQYFHCVHLLSEFNSQTGQNPPLSFQKIMDSHAKPFWEYVRARIRTIQRAFTARTNAYQVVPHQHNIIRHTPFRNQKVYLTSAYMDWMETAALAEAFNNDYLKYADYEGVTYWQNLDTPDTISATKFTYFDNSSNSWIISPTTTDPIVTEKILGMIFDEDFMTVNIKDTIIQNTPMNARGLYYNTWLTAHAQYCTDFTEKCCVLLLD